MSETPSKKRDAPVRATPVSHKGVTYDAKSQTEESWGSDPLPNTSSMFLVATGGDGELWRAKLYDIRYDPDMERDKQEVYVTGLSLNLLRTKIKAVDERGRKYAVDLTTHTVTGP